MKKQDWVIGPVKRTRASVLIVCLCIGAVVQIHQAVTPVRA